MTDETAIITPDVPAAPPAPALPAVPTPVELPTQEDVHWSLTMREETAVRRRFGDDLDQLPADDAWRACAFIVRWRSGSDEEAAFAVADLLTTKQARAEFTPTALSIEYVKANNVRVKQIQEDLEAVTDELNGPESRLIATWFAASVEDLDGWVHARALGFIADTRAGVAPKDAKKAAADMTRRAAADRLRELAEAAGKDVPA